MSAHPTSTRRVMWVGGLANNLYLPFAHLVQQRAPWAGFLGLHSLYKTWGRTIRNVIWPATAPRVHLPIICEISVAIMESVSH